MTNDICFQCNAQILRDKQELENKLCEECRLCPPESLQDIHCSLCKEHLLKMRTCIQCGEEDYNLQNGLCYSCINQNTAELHRTDGWCSIS